ncbi:pentatricopeptide repeat domain-containing protein [Spizellomyces punctatus DAOM BR117]|uniref:Pentatricopeptide repeat domain-containing protein n=1 Tax=Spizellomyces punctatus (strain DAOM BR117) TaxID=645134 RepID=A0A0L0HRE0_SPIPD|nr:pentatricopeptide repeat domain-containing protein [Spizellomyces punctatus DAOM BR117]KND03941.1 pentatricopeptide repeat domain-containing protein [Spizellomyces punctatus DAOM BR117]|eukprot:XP_016611980.1 pentatricopeptide repeat domain-containing protein [Spizellomyces punctatus DAOM BR117]
MSRHLFLALSKALGGCPHRCRPPLSRVALQPGGRRMSVVADCPPKSSYRPSNPLCNGTEDCTTRNLRMGEYLSRKGLRRVRDRRTERVLNPDRHPTYGQTNRRTQGYHSATFPLISEESAHDAATVHLSKPPSMSAEVTAEAVTQAWQRFRALLIERGGEGDNIPVELLRDIFHTLAKGMMRKRRSAEYLRTVAGYMRQKGVMFFSEELEYLVAAQRILRNWGEALEVLDSLEKMRRPDDPPWRLGTYEAGMRAHIKQGNMGLAMGLLDRMEKDRIRPTARIFATLIDGAITGDDVSLALNLFQRMSDKGVSPDARSLALLLTAFRNDEEKLKRLYQMASESSLIDLPTNPVFQQSLISVSSRLGDLELAFKHLMFMKDSCADPSYQVAGYTMLIDGFLKRDQIPKRGMKMAEDLFEEMKRSGLRPNLKTYTVLMHGYLKFKGLHRVVQCFEELVAEGLQPDQTIYNIVLRACVLHGDIRKMEDVFQNLLDSGLQPNLHILSSLMAGYVVYHQLNRAMEVFESMGSYGLKPDVVAFNIIINGHGLQQDLPGVMRCWQQMLDHGMQPNHITYTSLLQALSTMLDPDVPKMHQRIFATEVKPDVYAYTLLIDDRLRRGQLLGAQQLFDDFLATGTKLNSVAFTTLMNAYIGERNHGPVAELFQRLTEQGGLIDGPVYHVLMRMLVNANRPQEVERIWAMMKGERIDPDKGNYAIAMQSYLQLWDVAKVWELLDEMKSKHIYPDEHVYHLVIKGFVGRWTTPGARAAVQAYKMMLAEGVIPAQVTFRILIVMACRRRDQEALLRFVRDAMAMGRMRALDGQLRRTVWNFLVDTRELAGVMEMADVCIKMAVLDDVLVVINRLAATRDVEGIIECWDKFASSSSGRIHDEIVSEVLEIVAIRCNAPTEAKQLWNNLVSGKYSAVSRTMAVGTVVMYLRALAYWDETEALIKMCTCGLVELGLKTSAVEKVLEECFKFMRWKLGNNLEQVTEFWKARDEVDINKIAAVP